MDNHIYPKLPAALREGDLVGLVSPSAPLAGRVPHRTGRAIEGIKQLGLQVILGQNALTVDGYLAGQPRERAADINQFFYDTRVKAIICMIGGLHYNQLLPYLDFTAIRQNPKVVVGYSDATVLNMAILQKTGLVTFYGPAALTQFGENPRIMQYTEQHFRKALMTTVPIGEVDPALEYTDEVLNWFNQEDLARPRTMTPNPGFLCLREGTATGRILGGCLPSLLHLRGTEFWPSFDGSLLLLETPEGNRFDESYSLDRIDMDFADLELSGIFERIAGLIVGRPFRMSAEDSAAFHELIVRRLNRYMFPILANVDVGHTDPMLTIPLGVRGKIDCRSHRSSLYILQQGVM